MRKKKSLRKSIDLVELTVTHQVECFFFVSHARKIVVLTLGRSHYTVSPWYSLCDGMVLSGVARKSCSSVKRCAVAVTAASVVHCRLWCVRRR